MAPVWCFGAVATPPPRPPFRLLDESPRGEGGVTGQNMTKLGNVLPDEGRGAWPWPVGPK